MAIEMKRKMIIVIGVMAVLVVALSASFCLKPKEASRGKKVTEKAELELVGVAEDEEAAKKAAEEYGIKLVSYNEGIAVYSTDKTYEEIVRLGEEKGLIGLSLNITDRAF